jgi:hypothetical protein
MLEILQKNPYCDKILLQQGPAQQGRVSKNKYHYKHFNWQHCW